MKPLRGHAYFVELAGRSKRGWGWLVVPLWFAVAALLVFGCVR